MTSERRYTVAVKIREQIVRGLASGALREGARLPTIRQLATELHANVRTIAGAYRVLVDDGLVEIRPRSGAFVAAFPSSQSHMRAPSTEWLADILARTVEQGIPVPTFLDWLHRATSASRVNVVVLANILDQVDGLARELREYLGVHASGFVLDSLVDGEPLPRALRRAHLLVTTEANAGAVRLLAGRMRKPHVVACVRDDLLTPEWRSLLARPVYAVVADPRFGDVIRAFVAPTGRLANLHVLVAGRDPINIPFDAPTYVTESARMHIGPTRLPTWLIAPTRVLTPNCAREILSAVLGRLLLAEGHRRGAHQ